MAAALELHGVGKRYGDGHAVRDLSFSVEPGRIFGFLGPNGAGKTTTLRMIVGLVPPTEGRIRILGCDDVRRVQHRIGFLPEERGLYKRMTPLDAVAFFAGLKGVSRSVARARGRAMLDAQGLGEAIRRPMKDLSKGMAQKVQLICALAHQPELVILDEPFSGLDPVNQQGLETLIRNLAAQGTTVLFSTHVMAHAERLCERIALMARGRKVFEGTVAQARAAAPTRLVLNGDFSRKDVAALPGVTRIELDAPLSADQPAAGASARYIATLGPDASVQDAMRAALQHGLDLQEFRVEAPTLHEAFIVLTGAAV